MTAAEALIARFALQPLPDEGGWFARTWTGPATTAGGRPAGTSILYLLAGTEFSALHRLPTDEVWHFHAGDAVELFRLDPATGAGGWLRLGPAVSHGDQPQAVVSAKWWQGARLAAGGSWALLGCTLAPGWEPAGFERGERAGLRAAFPHWAAVVEALTREA